MLVEISDKLERFCEDGKEKELKKRNFVIWIFFPKKNYLSQNRLLRHVSISYIRKGID